MATRILSLAGNMLDIAFGVTLVIESVIRFFHFWSFPDIIASLFLIFTGAMIVLLEVIEVNTIRDLFLIYWYFIGRGTLFLFLAAVGGAPWGFGLVVFIVGASAAVFWFVARFLGLTHEDVHPLTSSASSYKPVGNPNQTTA